MYIPHGAYCYSNTGRMVVCNRVIGRNGELVKTSGYYIRPENKICDFWKSDGSGGATCGKLNIHSEYGDTDLLWDQIKICDINFEEPEYFPISHFETLDRERKKIEREYLSSIVDALLRSPENEFKYDGKVYTLSKHVLRDYNRI